MAFRAKRKSRNYFVGVHSLDLKERSAFFHGITFWLGSVT
jgi:hypothetical protein